MADEEIRVVPLRSIWIHLDRLMVYAEMAKSKSAARRLIWAGAVEIDEEKVYEADTSVQFTPEDPTFVLRVGRQQKRIKVS